MSTLAWALGLLVAALCLHLAVWRLSLPQNQLGALIKFFFCVQGVWLGGNAGLGLAGQELYGLPLAVAPCLMVALFFQATAWAYVVLYTTIDADSPSITILLALHRAGPRGLSLAELIERTGMERFFASRVDRLLRDGMVERGPAGYSIAAKGLGLVRLVRFWRLVMGAVAEVN